MNKILIEWKIIHYKITLKARQYGPSTASGKAEPGTCNFDIVFPAWLSWNPDGLFSCSKTISQGARNEGWNTDLLSHPVDITTSGSSWVSVASCLRSCVPEFSTLWKSWLAPFVSLLGQCQSMCSAQTSALTLYPYVHTGIFSLYNNSSMHLLHPWACSELQCA